MSSPNQETIEIHARDLTIFKGDDSRHWEWIEMQDTDGAQVAVAKLLEINMLEVSTTFPLTPKTKYQVEFVLKMNDGAVGFIDHPVHFKLVIPKHLTIEHRQDLSHSPNNEWTRVHVGKFSTSDEDTAGDLKIWMYEHGSQKKSGMIVNKVTISRVNGEPN